MKIALSSLLCAVLMLSAERGASACPPVGVSAVATSNVVQAGCVVAVPQSVTSVTTLATPAVLVTPLVTPTVQVPVVVQPQVVRTRVVQPRQVIRQRSVSRVGGLGLF